MGHFEIENHSPFAFEALILSDEEGRPVLVGVVKATYVLDRTGRPAIAGKQLAVNILGQSYGQSGTSSYKYEPETAFVKPATDVVLIGRAYPSGTGCIECDVRFQVGPVRKTVKVVGDRYWVKSLGTISMTAPEPFESIPLLYERSFGGWDRTHADPDRHSFEARNPVGTGFRLSDGKFEDGIRLPNLEDPRNSLRNYGDTPPPAGFGFTSPDWQPRAALAGTYDEQWMSRRMPLLPKNFDHRFFNAASPGLIAPGYLKGNESVLVENGSPRGRISFNLPGVVPPICNVQLRDRDVHIETCLDTIIVNADEDLLLLIWRGRLALRNGPHDIASIQIHVEGLSAQIAED
jgi:hypothetical protein